MFDVAEAPRDVGSPRQQSRPARRTVVMASAWRSVAVSGAFGYDGFSSLRGTLDPESAMGGSLYQRPGAGSPGDGQHQKDPTRRHCRPATSRALGGVVSPAVAMGGRPGFRDSGRQVHRFLSVQAENGAHTLSQPGGASSCVPRRYRATGQAASAPARLLPRSVIEVGRASAPGPRSSLVGATEGRNRAAVAQKRAAPAFSVPQATHEREAVPPMMLPVSSNASYVSRFI